MDWKLRLCLVVFAILFFCYIGTEQFPLKGLGLSMCEVNRSYTKDVPYQTIEYYAEKVPYTNIEYASKQEPYNTEELYTEKQCVNVSYTARVCSEESINYSIIDRECYTTGWLQDWMNIKCKVQNLDSQGGSFVIYTGFTSTDMALPSGDWNIANQTGENMTVYISPASTRTVYYTHEFSASNSQYGCSCIVTPPTKEVCRDVEAIKQICSDVTESRTLTDLTKNLTVTEYKNETRNMSVTKYRTETTYQVVEEKC